MANNLLGLGTDLKNLKIGDSFLKNGQTSFHTLKYDFIPASIDTTKIAEMKIGPLDKVNVTIPHKYEIKQTIFKGLKRPCARECVLIIDLVTGEITLERLTNHIQFKKIRDEPKKIIAKSNKRQFIESKSDIIAMPVHKIRKTVGVVCDSINVAQFFHSPKKLNDIDQNQSVPAKKINQFNLPQSQLGKDLNLSDSGSDSDQNESVITTTTNVYQVE
uniref:Ell-associated factor Eaf n=1 Tax=Strigamia maritima TaxID=126957 RepID=T1J7L8_STRMM